MLGQRSYDIEVLSDSEYLITPNKGFSKINDLDEVIWPKKINQMINKQLIYG